MADRYVALPLGARPNTDLRPACTLSRTRAQVEDRTGLRLDVWPDSGLGPTRGVIGKTPTDTLFAIESLDWRPECVTLCLDPASPRLGAECRALLAWPGASPNEVDWIVESQPERGYNVYRVDDNANRFLVANYKCRAQAAFWVAEYEARGHKQSYSYEEVGG
jgi:hypothetical protein